MDNAGAQRPADLREALQVMQQCIDQRSAADTRSGMHDHACWFIHHNQFFVFVEYFQRKRFRVGVQGRRRGPLHPQAFSSPEAVAGFERPGRLPSIFISSFSFIIRFSRISRYSGRRSAFQAHVAVAKKLLDAGAAQRG